MGDTPPRFVPLLFTACVLAVLYLLFKRIAIDAARNKLINEHGCQPPAKYPHRDPFFGLDAIRDGDRAARSKTYLERTRRLYERHGNTFTSQILTLSVINTIEPENIQAVLFSKFDDYETGWLRRDAFSPLLGQSMILSDGIEWQHSRALLRPSFSRSQVENLPMFESHVQDLIRAIPRDGTTVDLAVCFARLTADVTLDLMFGESTQSPIHPESARNQADFVRAFHHAEVGGDKRLRWGKLAKLIPQPKFYRSIKQVHRYMDGYVDRAVTYRASHRTEPQEWPGMDEPHVQNRYIFFHELSKVTDNAQKIRDELLTIFFAGRDTTSGLLGNLFFVLARRPDVWRKLRAEIAQLRGGKPTLEQLNAMKYLKSCLNESLRVHPVVPTTSRIATRDTVLPVGGGANGSSPVFVPAGTMVAFHVSALYQRQDLWGADAGEYRPERWENEKLSRNFLPFSRGPRVCIGQQLAMTEACYTTVRLVQEFSHIETRDPEPWTESLALTCRSANGVKVVMTSDPERQL